MRLSVPPVFRLAGLDAVVDGVVGAPREARSSTTVYVDTEDLRLARWGVSLCHRQGEGWTVRLPSPGADPAQVVATEHTFAGTAAHVAEGAIDLLRAYLRSSEVVPMARLRTLSQELAMVGPDGETLARVIDDEVTILAGRRVAGRFREIEVAAGAAAPEGLLDAIVERLVAAGASPSDPTPRYLRAVGARGMAAPEVDLGVRLDPDTPAATAIRRAIGASVARLLRHDPGVRLGDDPEDVHQARVATRRLRSDLRTFRPLLDPEWVDALRDQLRWIAAELGEVRDSEVLAARLRGRVDALPARDRSGAARLLEGLDQRREAARARLLEAMRSIRYVELLDRLVEAAAEPPTVDEAAMPASETLPGLAVRPWEKLRGAVRALGDPPGDEELHGVRIRAKRCRYAAEAVAPVAGRQAADFARAVARLQDVLGEHHDASVAHDWLRGHAGRGARGFAAGELAGLELVAAGEARDRWPAAWRSVRKRRPRQWTRRA